MRHVLFTATVLALLLTAGGAMAAMVGGSSSTTLDVSAQVTASCFFSTGSGALDFGALDAGSAPAVGPTAAATDLVVTCANLKDYLVSDDGGLYWGLGGGQWNLRDDTSGNTYYISYSITYNGQGGVTLFGTGAPQPLNIQGTIPALSYLGYPIDTYSDTITFTLDF